MEIYAKDFDTVINGVVATGCIKYSDAIIKLVPLISKTDFQRKLQDKKFYEKLERDIEKGCIMPPITLAYVDSTINTESTIEDIRIFFEKNYEKSFVLDGIQRLNTLSRVNKNNKLDSNKTLYVNIIFSDSVDKLLYRMITLNNGQKPMTPRHQVEMIMANAFDFDKLGIEIQSEKERAEKVKINSFSRSDIVQAYLAYMASSPMIDNKKIIEEKMDELIVNKIISNEPIDEKSNFKDVLIAISKFQHSPTNLKWLKQANNLVGFSVGMKFSKDIIKDITSEEFEHSIKNFEIAFSDFNPSKIKLGKMRRELSFEFFKNFSKLKSLDSSELLEHFSDITNE
jgi:hypothetical protein